MGICHRDLQRLITQTREPVECAEGLQPCERLWMRRHQPHERGHHISLAPLHKQPLGQITQWPIGVFEDRQACVRIVTPQSRHLGGFFIAWRDPVDPPPIAAGTKPRPQFLFPHRWQPVGMLDHEAIHVDHPQGSVRPCAGHHGPTPTVSAGKEIESVFSRITTTVKRHPARLEQVVLHKIVKRLTREGVLLATPREEETVAVDHG